MSIRIDNARGLYPEGIRDGRPREAVTRYTGARYTQHSTGVHDGVEGFAEFFAAFLARSPQQDVPAPARSRGRPVRLRTRLPVPQRRAAQWDSSGTF